MATGLALQTIRRFSSCKSNTCREPFKPVRRGPKRAGMREIERAILSENGALVQKEAEK